MAEFTVFETEFYSKWFKQQTPKSKRQIQNRINNIEELGHFGHKKPLGKNGLQELKFNDGRRIYFVIVPISSVILLIGGNKNGQEKDIKYCEKILREFI